MATSPLLYAAESWEKVYKAFEEVNFTAYDYDAVKQSLIDYLKVHYPENFNDYIESSQLIALIELFAYVAEILSYRVDMAVHENLLPTATRKQSILRLAKLISYTASRNLPLRGLVKIDSISISEDIRDSQGNSLTNRVIKWDDQNNPIWREQFFTVINKVLTQQFGNAFKSFQIDDTIFQQYEISNVLEVEDVKSIFNNGVVKFKVKSNGDDLNFELVPADIDQHGVFERDPNPNSYFNILYANDGGGDGSNTTGFMMYLKQGELIKLPYVFDTNLPNRVIDVNVPNINDADVWVQEIDAQGIIVDQWENVPNVAGNNLAFNNIANTKKYEIETLEDDQIRIIFGDGDFADIPTGVFNIWVRSSSPTAPIIPKTTIDRESVTFLYTSKTGRQESCTFTFSLVSALQNSAQSEDIEHIRSVAPSVYYTQNRMVNGQDYNSLFLKDASILRMFAVNRTFSGQPKYVDWNDASGSYQNVKLFGNDLRLYYDIKSNAKSSSISSRSLIDEVLEPALTSPGVYNMIVYSYYKSLGALGLAYIKPRTKFIESSLIKINNESILEKTEIQGALDRHWYGEPIKKVQLDINLEEMSSLPKTIFGIVDKDSDQRVYDSNLKLVYVDPITGAYVRVTHPGGISGIQETVIRQKRFGIRFDTDRPFSSTLSINPYVTLSTEIRSYDFLTSESINQSIGREEVYTIEVTDEFGNFSVYSSLSGYQAPGKMGIPYSNGIISFIIGVPHAVTIPSIVIGDSFIVKVNKSGSVFSPEISRFNLLGRFKIIDESELYNGIESKQFSIDDPTSSWLFIIERTDDDNGNPIYWTVVSRDFNLVAESSTTKFWYDQDSLLIDSQTKTQVRDMVRILKSNLDVSGTRAIGVDHIYQVVSSVKHSSGETNFNALLITPSMNSREIMPMIDSRQLNALEFLRFIGGQDYVYFKADKSTGNLSSIPRTVYIESLPYVNNISGEYVRRNGRDNLDFMWQHFTPNDHLIDPSNTNIIDMFILTKGYYLQVQDYINGVSSIEPTPPTSLELKNAYRTYIDNKMISDTVILHPGRVKCLFGSHAIPELRAKFKIVVSPEAKMTGDQIRAKALDVVKEYFKIENWDFGQSFYATELCAVIHKSLATEISSVVLVPEFPTNYFGDLFYIRSAQDEILMSCADLSTMEIISGIDRISLRQGSNSNTGSLGESSSCNYILSSVTGGVPSINASGSISVITNTQTCPWTASPNVSWIKLLNNSGIGNGVINFTCTDNLKLSQRTGTVSIQGKIYTLTQEGVICSYQISSTSASVTNTNASGSFTLTTNSPECTWTAVSPSWIHLSLAHGTGTKVISFTCDDNMGPQRVGLIIIGGYTFTVTQAAVTCSYSLSTNAVLVPALTSTGSVSIIPNSSSCNWTASSPDQWIHISHTNGTGNFNLNYTCDSNPLSVTRTGRINVSGQELLITQAQKAPCTFTISPTSAVVTKYGNNIIFNVTTGDDCTWTATTMSSWLHDSNGNGSWSGKGNGTVQIAIDANPGNATRQGTILIGDKMFTIDQGANSIGGSTTVGQHSA